MAKRNHYINNETFTKAVVQWQKDFIENSEKAYRSKTYNFIGECIMLLCKKLVNMPRFFSYSYKDQFVSDAILDCVQRLQNFDYLFPAKLADRMRREMNNELKFYAEQEWSKKVITDHLQGKLERKIKKMSKSTAEKYQAEIDTALALYEASKWDSKIITDNIKKRTEEAILNIPPPNAFAYFTRVAFNANVRRIKDEHKQRDIKIALIKNSSLLEDISSDMDADPDIINALKYYLETVDKPKVEIEKKFRSNTKAHRRTLEEMEEKEALVVRSLTDSPDYAMVSDTEELDDISTNEELDE